MSGPTWTGSAQPSVAYDRTAFLTRWWVLGPVESYLDEAALAAEEGSVVTDSEGRALRWEALEADARGAVATGPIVEYRGARRVAYFRTRIRVPEGAPYRLALSTVDDVAVWVNGRFFGFGGGGASAWWDAPWNPEHDAIAFSRLLPPGDSEVVIRVVGGVYARGGFYVWLAGGS